MNEAIATGARSVSYQGQKVEYRELSEMMRIRDEMERQLGATSTKRRSRAVFRGGF